MKCKINHETNNKEYRMKPTTIIISSGKRKAEIVQKSDGKSKTIHLRRKGKEWKDRSGKTYNLGG